ncbi:MAG: hypothetical protein KBT47_05985, partial [Armatimonadetes bacterium]|nr:hypothetical protein [Candidatus Hippobium faecium]
QGRDTEGPTSLLNSVFKINQEGMLGGTVLNLKFDKSLYSQKKSFQAIKNIIETYMKNGGFQTQINITDAEELKKAQKDPDNYRHIIVRVAGYSDYFTALEKSCQDEIIRRSTI